jgi:hypothetical protein
VDLCQPVVLGFGWVVCDDGAGVWIPKILRSGFEDEDGGVFLGLHLDRNPGLGAAGAGARSFLYHK